MTEPTPQPMAPQPAAPLTAAEDKQWASFAHFGGILWFLPALIIFLVFKDRGTLTRQESKEALNWQITWIGAWIILEVLWVITAAVFFPIALLIGFLQFALYVVNLIFSILGGVKVNGGGSYRYPVALRLIK
ncbi:DUF4870 domain-containing protein [Lacisediminihabitans sp.]|jgi:uncharacterized Tic20 family protein|uniref:DUF4870 domain-containing protein n=1 Tax=Lacisediminihabitans sp. TaxID=2787631 RepID=UPI002F959199